MTVTAARGFRAAGATAGLKASGSPDVALVVNDGPLRSAAAVFTSNRFKANPVLWSEQVVTDVTELVRLSGRFKGYAEGWSDAAVRRYARDAGHLLGRLNQLVRCDCTTRSQIKVANLHRDIDDLTARIAQLADEDRVAAERPGIDGGEVMAHLGIGPGRDVGQALGFLLAIKLAEGDHSRDELFARLDAWWAERTTR